jgi:hypothetical protein
MEHNKSRDEFLIKFKEKYPDFKIIEFTNISAKIIVEDSNGCQYKKNKAEQSLKSNFTVQSIVDKYSYIQDKINQYHNNLILIKYDGVKKRVTVEDENKFRYNPQCYDLIKGSKVTIETCDNKEELFKFKANKVHNNFYKYPIFKYINGKTRINVICPIHGDFNQICESHLCGHGCPKCNTVGFSKESWLKYLKVKLAFFYVLRVFNDNEEFIKVGITSKTVKDRYRTLKNYKIEIIKLIEDTPSKVYDIEKHFLKEFKKYRILPTLPFEGWSECLNISCLKKIKNYEDFSNF